MKPNASVIFIILTALVAAGGAYWFFFIDAGTAPPITAVGAAHSPMEAQFQTLVAQLQPINFDTSIFTDPRFMALRDLTTPIAPETIGRPDPFAPVAGLRAQ